MGIKYFFSWFKKSFSDSIKKLSLNQSFDISIDHFLIDLNGIFHYCAQKTYRYGSFKSNKKVVHSEKQQLSYLFSQVGLYLTNLVSFVKNLDMGAVALTDHGVMFGAIEFYKECKAQGIKPLIGIETYIVNKDHKSKSEKEDKDNNHLVLIAKDYEGYKNLLKITKPLLKLHFKMLKITFQKLRMILIIQFIKMLLKFVQMIICV